MNGVNVEMEWAQTESVQYVITDKSNPKICKQKVEQQVKSFLKCQNSNL